MGNAYIQGMVPPLTTISRVESKKLLLTELLAVPDQINFIFMQFFYFFALYLYFLFFI